MIIGLTIQDTIRVKKVSGQDSLRQVSDSSGVKPVVQRDAALPQNTIYSPQSVKIKDSDTDSLSIRNSIADVTFYDSLNVVTRIDETILQNFPFVFTEISRRSREETKATLVKNLKSGDDLAAIPFHYDWVLPVILSSILFYAVLKAESGKLFNRLFKFFSFRPSNEISARDTSSLFHWQSSLFNLASFINIGLFAFFTSQWYEVLPVRDSWFVYWLGILLIVIAAFTLRVFACLITGSVSGEREIFRDYLMEIYQTYRFAGLALMIINVLIVYTTLLPENILFYSGFFLIALSYLIRVLKLFFIFINRHIPIFYLILYLCALEILPVVIIVKYITGLV